MLTYIRSQEFVRIQTLARRFGVSTVTVRSDVDLLARDGSIRRVRGGVMQTLQSVQEVTYEERSDSFIEEKRRIADAAVGMLSPGDSVVLDGGTTTMAIARAIADRADLVNLTVFTAALNVALALERAIPRVQVVVTGGTLRPQQHSLVEPLNTLILERIQATFAFIGCNSLHPDKGIMAIALPDTALKQTLLKSAHRTVVVADSSKFRQSALARVCGLDEVDLILTAGHVDPATLDVLADVGANIRVAGAPAPAE